MYISPVFLCRVTYIYSLQIANKKRIVECILLYDALHKRRIYLDAFGSRLEALGMKILICHFPEVFKASFVYNGKITPSNVIKMLQPHPDAAIMNEDTKRVWDYLITFLNGATE